VGGTSFTIGASGSVTKDVQVTTVGSTVFSTPSATCNFGSPSCTFTSTLAGFIFDVPNHVSDTLQTVNVSAVKQSDSSLACTPAFASVSKTVSFACSYSNPATGTLPVAVNGTNIACGTAGGVSLAFNASGVASTTFRYADVGSVGLTATYTGSGGTETGLTMTGSDSFIAAPASFTVVPAGPYIAGSAFSATVTAKNASGNTTPNFGKETTAATVTLTHTVTGGTAGTAPADFVGTLGAFGATTAGVASGNNLAWKEVGDISVTGTLTGGSYLGSGLTATGSGPAGPFKPGYFETVVTPAAGTFTYSGQPFSVQIIAKSNWAGNPTTTNYDNTLGYSKAVTLTDANSGANNSSALGTLANTSVPAASFSSGVATVANVTYTFTSKMTAPLEGPTSSPLKVRATETADPTVSSSGHESLTTSVTSIRSGRLKLSNAFGSEKSPLTMVVQAQYWSGQTWVANSADGSTSLAANAFALSGALAGSTSASTITLVGGVSTLTLAAPGPATGSVDVAINLGISGSDQSCLATHGGTAASKPWLRSQNGSCPTAYDSDPSARATFGVYALETRKSIHVREQF
jgi:MSHA biogenesis protein MshQ